MSGIYFGAQSRFSGGAVKILCPPGAGTPSYATEKD